MTGLFTLSFNNCVSYQYVSYLIIQMTMKILQMLKSLSQFCFASRRSCNMNGLLPISVEHLPTLRQLFEAQNPLQLVTTTAIGHFIERFKKKPEWSKIVTFWSVNDKWKETGTFAMINTHDDHIFFNTLEPFPYESLRKTLELIDYSRPMVFISFRDIFRPIVFEVIRTRNLHITFDSGARNLYMEQPETDIKVEYDVNYSAH